jgi:hypothetical protein
VTTVVRRHRCLWRRPDLTADLLQQERYFAAVVAPHEKHLEVPAELLTSQRQTYRWHPIPALPFNFKRPLLGSYDNGLNVRNGARCRSAGPDPIPDVRKYRKFSKSCRRRRWIQLFCGMLANAVLEGVWRYPVRTLRRKHGATTHPAPR